MQTYQNMKDSGVAWLGKIPAEWQKKRAKFIFQKVQQTPRKDDEVVTAFRDGEVVLRSLRREDGFTFANKEIGYQHVSKGDLVIHAMDAFAGAIGVSKSDGKMSPVCSICQPVDDSTSTRYYSYLLRAMTKTNYLVAIAKGIRERSTDFRYSDFGNMLLPVPSSSQQQKIADFLDTETAQIDNLIAKQERLLELLEEKRRATITHAVTRGLNPSVELKETNIPWLGQIPAGWKLGKVYQYCKTGSGTTPNASLGNWYTDKEIDSLPWITTGELRENTIKDSKVRVTNEAIEKHSALKIYSPGTLLIAMYGATIGRLATLGIEATTNQACCALMPTNALSTRYLYYYLFGLRDQLIFLSSGGGQPNISKEKIDNFPLLIPNIRDQELIATMLDKHEEKTALLKQKIQTQIKLLKERRTSLISHAVTGKIKI